MYSTIPIIFGLYLSCTPCCIHVEFVSFKFRLMSCLASGFRTYGVRIPADAIIFELTRMSDTLQSPSFDLKVLNARHPSLESPIAIKSLTGPGGLDLSLSELSLDDLPSSSSSKTLAAPPFDLVASSISSKTPTSKKEEPFGTQEIQTSNEQEGLGQTETENQVQPTTPSKSQSRNQSREERLQSDLFILRTLNGAITGYIDALKSAKDLTEVCYNFDKIEADHH
jgi:hypothetical protein